MSKKKAKNFLDYIPARRESLKWDMEGEIVVLHMENKGFFAYVAQKLFHRPRYSHIRLERFGSFIWQQIDGKRTLYDISLLVKEHFGNEAEPLYDRFVTYVRTLYGHEFIYWKNKK